MLTTYSSDPAIIGDNNRWYAFATRTMGGNIHIQVAESTDFENWSIVTNADGSQKDALPTLPSWVDGGNSNTVSAMITIVLHCSNHLTKNLQWAPDVIKLDDGSFMMYYSATTKQDTAKHCIGAAKASSVTGPYKPVSDQALICPLAQGGALDAAVYNDNGQRWITWKVDGNSIGNGGACGNTGK
jgi:beta-xylosidase